MLLVERKIESVPPKNNNENIKHIKIILRYSAIKKNAKPKPEYSTLYPETNSASASGKSKGDLFVSAKADKKKKILKGKKKKQIPSTVALLI
jgi:hypothetical protein